MSESGKRYKAMVDKLKEHNHKLTPQRLAIIKILSQSEGHPSVEDIYRELQRNFPGISEATVYRNILLIKSLGEVLELGFAGEGTRYDGRKPHPHPHIVCVTCRKIIDPDLESLNQMTKEITRESGFEILTYRLDFFGICPECRGKKT
jgi:Fur family peroxide stress response transcriptional regulator